MMRSDDTDDVEQIFTVQFVDDFHNVEKVGRCLRLNLLLEGKCL